ncbi:hypothetical protein QTA56_07625 [Acinetobacter sp. VNH17]|uniref:Phage tail protein n=1 Tax=Acinetobacter thutiue TaxID=2998078 RepID=A0ABT7WN68_9GAMM|nr:hypothetical protein [Acinetobacter thutiue]MCY6412001.1 hypothetical protein [Acinetobacter thutiue]MDN0014105.1 hypothetical protein [Acinetobacter thutiue]
MSNIALKVFWSNEPMPLNRKIDRAAINVPFGVMITHPTGLIKSVNGKVGDVVLNAADVGADVAGLAETVQQNLNTEVNTLNIQLDSLSSQTIQIQTLAQTNELKISTKADQADLETTQQQVEQNRLAILTKADIQALAQLALLVDTKADQSYVNQQIANLVGSAPEALNTIYELAAAIQNDQSLIDSLNQSVANRVRFDIATQALTEIQKDNARTNIGAEKLGTAQQLVGQITTASIGAATAAQGAKADTALQSADVAPVALSGLFSSLGGQNKIFDVVFSAYAVGSNTAISVADTLGQMLGKLQAQHGVWVLLTRNADYTAHANVTAIDVYAKIVSGLIYVYFVASVSSIANGDIFLTLTNTNFIPKALSGISGGFINMSISVGGATVDGSGQRISMDVLANDATGIGQTTRFRIYNGALTSTRKVWTLPICIGAI